MDSLPIEIKAKMFSMVVKNSRNVHTCSVLRDYSRNGELDVYIQYQNELLFLNVVRMILLNKFKVKNGQHYFYVVIYQPHACYPWNNTKRFLLTYTNSSKMHQINDFLLSLGIKAEMY